MFSLIADFAYNHYLSVIYQRCRKGTSSSRRQLSTLNVVLNEHPC